jgi:hypothetical protein
MPTSTGAASSSHSISGHRNVIGSVPSGRAGKRPPITANFSTVRGPRRKDALIIWRRRTAVDPQSSRRPP